MVTSGHQTMLRVRDKAQARNCVELDLVNTQENVKFTREQVHYLQKLTKQVHCLDGELASSTDTYELINYFESLSDCQYKILCNETGSGINDDNDGLSINALNDPSEFAIPQCSSVAIFRGRKREYEEVLCNTEKQHTVSRPVQNGNWNCMDIKKHPIDNKIIWGSSLYRCNRGNK
eukprot:7825920-Ditylum_brightwellii.AAC.1